MFFHSPEATAFHSLTPLHPDSQKCPSRDMDISSHIAEVQRIDLIS
jgi:hypothetical protein